MKARQEFITRKIAGETVLVPTGTAAADFNGIITLNDTALFIWESLAEDLTPEELLSRLLEEFDTEEETARKDMEEFLEQLRNHHMLAE